MYDFYTDITYCPIVTSVGLSYDTFSHFFPRSTCSMIHIYLLGQHIQKERSMYTSSFELENTEVGM